jgi:hypothetical protein
LLEWNHYAARRFVLSVHDYLLKRACLYEVANDKQLFPSCPHPTPGARGKVGGEAGRGGKESATRDRDELRRQARILSLANDAVRGEPQQIVVVAISEWDELLEI